jgi:2-methylcitrate dehydratase
MPYIFARAFVDGAITVQSYEPHLVTDPSIRPLMNKIKVRNSHEVDAIYKSSYPYCYFLRTTVTGVDGTKSVHEITNPRGVPQNPMSEEEVEAKFLSLSQPVLGNAKARAAIEMLRALDTAASVTPALDAIVS